MTSSSTTSPSHLTRGYLSALAAAAVLSTTAVFIRYLVNTYALPPLVLALWRDAFVVLTLVVALAALRIPFRQVSRQNLRLLAAYGFVLASFNATWTFSVALNGAALATVLAYSSAAFTALLGWWLLKERLGWAKLLAVALSLGGCVLVSGALDAAAWQANLGGIVTGVLAGLCYAGYSLMGRVASQRGLNPWVTLLYTFGFATLFLLAANLLPGGILPGAAAHPAELLWLGNVLSGWGVLFLLAAGPTVLGFGLYNLSLSHLPSSVANLIVTLEPAFTAAIAYVLLGERLNGVQIGGSLLILSGVALMRAYEGWLARRAAAGAASVAGAGGEIG
jgi:drug/metabolite transporter (DMT)-like permease